MQPTDQTVNSMNIYAEAKACLGQSLVPVGDDPELGCAVSVSVLLNEKCGIPIKVTQSTYELLQELISSPRFREVYIPIFGDIIISPTGTSTISNTPITHGHVGCVAKYGILSNNSYTGLWGENYTLDSWRKRYQVQGGYPVRFFRAV